MEFYQDGTIQPDELDDGVETPAGVEVTAVAVVSEVETAGGVAPASEGKSG